MLGVFLLGLGYRQRRILGLSLLDCGLNRLSHPLVVDPPLSVLSNLRFQLADPLLEHFGL